MRRPRAAERRSPLVMLGCLALSAYFIHHAVYGRHGIVARARLIDRQVIANQEFNRLDAIRSGLQRDVGLLGSNPPHPDLVEETATALLGYARPGDRITVLRGL